MPRTAEEIVEYAKGLEGYELESELASGNVLRDEVEHNFAAVGAMGTDGLRVQAHLLRVQSLECMAKNDPVWGGGGGIIPRIYAAHAMKSVLKDKEMLRAMTDSLGKDYIGEIIKSTKDLVKKYPNPEAVIASTQTRVSATYKKFIACKRVAEILGPSNVSSLTGAGTLFTMAANKYREAARYYGREVDPDMVAAFKYAVKSTVATAKAQMSKQQLQQAQQLQQLQQQEE